MRRLLLSVVLFLLLVPVAAGAQDGERRLDVIDISGPLDDQAVDFAHETILDTAERGTEAVIIQLDSQAVVADASRFDTLLELVADPPVPLAVWVGPAPAVAFGGAVDLLMAAPLRLAAPGVEIGLAAPTIAGSPDRTSNAPEALAEAFIVVEGPVHGVVDAVAPAIRQIVQGLDGTVIEVRGEPRRLSTLTTTQVNGQEQVTAIDTVFHKPGYWARFLRLAVTPEAVFLFLIAGLTVAAFEFYAIGPGVAAGVAALSLFLSAYGMTTLPLRWWGVAAVLAGWVLLTLSYQRGGVVALTSLGGIAVGIGGLFFVDGAPQLEMNPLATLAIVAATLLFYTVAMPTVARSRFSTRTIGRDHLIGSHGTALVDFDPDGEIEVDGARWKAAAHREAGIRRGSLVRITEVDGLILEVEPVAD